MDMSLIEDRKTRARAWFEALRNDICVAFERLEDDAPSSLYPGDAGRFVRTPSWSTRNQPASSRPRITIGRVCGFSSRASVSARSTLRSTPPSRRVCSTASESRCPGFPTAS